MRFFERMSAWLDAMPSLSEDAPDKAVRVRTTHTVNGYAGKPEQIDVEINSGVVEITGDIRGLTINGRKVRFKEPT